MPDEHTFRDDVAAYALGALEPDEVEALEKHLIACTVCADELRAFEHVEHLLAEDVPPHPAPSRLRRRVLGEVRRSTSSEGVLQRRPAHGRYRAWRPVLAAAAVIAALAVTLQYALTGADAPAVRTYRASVTASAGSAYVRVTGSRGELLVKGLPHPAPGDVYELWLVHGHGAPQATTTLFDVDRAGVGDVDVPGSLRGVTRIMVTQERQGGSRAPTLPAVISARLA